MTTLKFNLNQQSCSWGGGGGGVKISYPNIIYGSCYHLQPDQDSTCLLHEAQVEELFIFNQLQKCKI